MLVFLKLKERSSAVCIDALQKKLEELRYTGNIPEIQMVLLEIAELHKKLGTTIVYVIHDQVEAMTLGHRIVVMNRRVYSR